MSHTAPRTNYRDGLSALQDARSIVQNGFIAGRIEHADYDAINHAVNTGIDAMLGMLPIAAGLLDPVACELTVTPTKTVARRFPAHQGYRTRHDVPTRADLIAQLLNLYMQGEIGAYYLASACRELSGQRRDTVRDRALNILGELHVRRCLTGIEHTTRIAAGGATWTP